MLLLAVATSRDVATTCSSRYSPSLLATSGGTHAVGNGNASFPVVQGRSSSLNPTEETSIVATFSAVCTRSVELPSRLTDTVMQRPAYGNTTGSAFEAILYCIRSTTEAACCGPRSEADDERGTTPSGNRSSIGRMCLLLLRVATAVVSIDMRRLSGSGDAVKYGSIEGENFDGFHLTLHTFRDGTAVPSRQADRTLSTGVDLCVSNHSSEKGIGAP
jgi:hypothetical protein